MRGMGDVRSQFRQNNYNSRDTMSSMQISVTIGCAGGREGGEGIGEGGGKHRNA